MFLNVHLIRKADDYALQRCEVAEVVEISHEEFNELKSNPLQDYSFIAENKDKLEYENVSTVPCIMFLDSDGDDGVLVDPQGYDRSGLAGQRNRRGAERDTEPCP